MILDQCQQLRKEEFQQSAELIRLQTATLVNVQLKHENQMKPGELWKFDWDKAENDDGENLTESELKAHNAKLAAAFN